MVAKAHVMFAKFCGSLSVILPTVPQLFFLEKWRRNVLINPTQFLLGWKGEVSLKNDKSIKFKRNSPRKKKMRMRCKRMKIVKPVVLGMKSQGSLSVSHFVTRAPNVSARNAGFGRTTSFLSNFQSRVPQSFPKSAWKSLGRQAAALASSGAAQVLNLFTGVLEKCQYYENLPEIGGEVEIVERSEAVIIYE